MSRSSPHISHIPYVGEHTIATPFGMVPIKNLKVGDQVFDVSGTLVYISKIIINPQGISSLWLSKSMIPTIKL